MERATVQGCSETRETQELMLVLETGTPKSEEAQEALAGLPKASAVSVSVCFHSLALTLDFCGVEDETLAS